MLIIDLLKAKKTIVELVLKLADLMKFVHIDLMILMNRSREETGTY